MIIPAIIAKDFKELKEKLSLVEGLVSWAHIDVMDGVFVAPGTWRAPEELNMVQTSLNLEAHLMIANPEDTIDAWLDSPVKRILLHYESTAPETLKALIEKTNKTGKEAGIVLKLATRLSVLDDFLLPTHYPLPLIQLMSIAKIGYHGHPFVRGTLGRIRVLREKYPHAIIEADGGVTLENAPSLCIACADRLVAGSAIFKSGDIKATIKKFNAALTHDPSTSSGQVK